MRKLLSRLYVVAIVLFMGLLVIRDWNGFSRAFLGASPALMFWAICANIAALLVQSQTWALIQRTTASETHSALPQPGFWEWTRLFLIGYLGRYIPGKVSMILGRVLALEPLGYSRASVVYAALFENFSFLVGASAVGVLAMIAASTPAIAALPFDSLLLLPLLACILALSASPFFETVFNRLFVKLSGTAAPETLKILPLPVAIRCRAVFQSVLSNALLGVSYALIIAALAETEFGGRGFISAVGAFPLAVGVGVLALFAPSGIGVREVAIVLLLNGVVAAPVALLGAVVVRVLMCGVELGLYAVAILLSGGAFSKRSIKSRC